MSSPFMINDKTVVTVRPLGLAAIGYCIVAAAMQDAAEAICNSDKIPFYQFRQIAMNFREQTLSIHSESTVSGKRTKEEESCLAQLHQGQFMASEAV